MLCRRKELGDYGPVAVLLRVRGERSCVGVVGTRLALPMKQYLGQVPADVCVVTLRGRYGGDQHPHPIVTANRGS